MAILTMLAVLAAIVALSLGLAGVAFWRFLSDPEGCPMDKAIAGAAALVCLGIIPLDVGQATLVLAVAVAALLAAIIVSSLWIAFTSADADLEDKVGAVVFSLLLLAAMGGLCLLLLYYCVKVGLAVF